MDNLEDIIIMHIVNKSKVYSIKLYKIYSITQDGENCAFANCTC